MKKIYVIHAVSANNDWSRPLVVHTKQEVLKYVEATRRPGSVIRDWYKESIRRWLENDTNDRLFIKAHTGEGDGYYDVFDIFGGELKD